MIISRINKMRLRHSLKVGIGFGLTSGVITTLGLMVGIYSGTQSETAVIAGILTIAFADSMSDALGIHIAEESEGIHTTIEIWVSTLTTFFVKFLITSSFLVPIILLSMPAAIRLCIIYGVILLIGYSLYLAKKQKQNPFFIIGEHLAIVALVLVSGYYVGVWVKNSF